MSDVKTDEKQTRDTTPPEEVGFVDMIPARTRNDYWTERISALRENPGKNKLFITKSSTTASYLKGAYGVITTTRSREDGRTDTYVQYPAKNVDGKLVPDEAKVVEIKAKHAKKAKSAKESNGKK